MKNAEDYRYCLDCFKQPRSEVDLLKLWDSPDTQQGSDDLDELSTRAEQLFQTGRFQCIVLYGWSPNGEDWDELDAWP